MFGGPTTGKSGNVPVVEGVVVQGEPVAQPIPPPLPHQYGSSAPEPPQYGSASIPIGSAEPLTGSGYGGGSTANFNGEPLTGSGYGGSSTADFNGTKGEIQGKKFNDLPFAIAFVVHLAIMLYFLAAYAGFDNGQNGDASYDYTGVVYCVSVCGVFALGLSTLALGFMMKFSRQLVKMALFFSIGLSLAVGIMGLLSGQILMGVMGLVSFAFGCCYAYFVWGRIPFAAANLNTALSAVKANMGLAVVAYFFLFVAFGWSIWWSVAAGGAMNGVGSGIVFLFLVSYYWTHQVIQNTVHVTTAGVIGTWWFVPDECSSCCSSALKDSFVRATTYSFGSICFGSLLVALVQALRTLQHMLRDNDDFNFLVCIIDCILGCIEAIIEYVFVFAMCFYLTCDQSLHMLTNRVVFFIPSQISEQMGIRLCRSLWIQLPRRW